METPFSKREWDLYKELKHKFLEEKNQTFDTATYHKYEDWLWLLKEKGVIWEIRADGAFLYGQVTEFNDFEKWIMDLDRKAKRLSRREWIIAIVSATIGAIIGLIPYFVQMLR